MEIVVKRLTELFEPICQLGRGSFGTVLLAHQKSEDGDDEFKKIPCAIKAVEIAIILAPNQITEVKILRELTTANAPFLQNMVCMLRSESHFFFVLDFLQGGSLDFHLMRSGRFDLDRARFYAAEILCALNFLHRRKIIHRDLKPANVMLDREGHACVTDFGLCEIEISTENPAFGICGTFDYAAPEMTKGKPYTFSVDWWSFGCVIYEMATGLRPFYGDSLQELFKQIEDPSLPDDLYLVPDLACQDLIQLLLERDPHLRLGSSTSPYGSLKAHPFFASAIDWQLLESRQIPPPFVPTLASLDDVRYFEGDFTRRTRLLLATYG